LDENLLEKVSGRLIYVSGEFKLTLGDLLIDRLRVISVFEGELAREHLTQ
jgi:hypothetical protein